MSQKKVDAYKKEKANRDKIIKKEKRILLIEKIAGLVVCLAAVCWIGYSVYAKVVDNREVVVQDTVMDTSALDEYVSGLTADAADAEDIVGEEDTEESGNSDETDVEGTAVTEDSDETDVEGTIVTEDSDETDTEGTAEMGTDSEETVNE